ncbi:hypothetical protein PC129_g16645 [Phytophthora cactorum]|uniref:Uncharacterized protein n=1 Tax=Phytophthora cactorum TaxID=29920 RepID=A0A329SG76_9STRA|nr:hypothetical protein Pcac1_g1328 [Phytophthora cactorum]KAG2809357.1 hypothetical protein PC112_g16540 [Phytophthora cactorum]KAG2810913.1 hypothetical protein PC111_g15447 [Phytophthora cactorum]KAG2857546.1 hypothetical protein PC113_g10592 [Phytophthora cactorum]KAG2906888.1 hypothetical protein PC114_g10981 [Phytophthora cactorum]
MEGDSPVVPTDFLQDLEFWLAQTGAASPTADSHSLDASTANAAVSSLEAALLTPTAPASNTDRSDVDASLVAALTDNTLHWAALTATSPVDSGSVTLPAPAPRPPTRQGAAKPTGTKTTRTRKGRPPAASKATGASPLEPPKKKGKTNKSTSQRQKEELAYLREKSEQLEAELETLKQRNREELERQQREEGQMHGRECGAMSTAMVTTSLDEFGAPAPSLWERIAKRQREEKAKAEVENVKLREMVQSQMRLVKSFERLLRKRRIWDQLQETSSQERGEGQNEEEMLASMLHDVDARYPQVDEVLEEHGLGESDPAVDVKENANMKFSLEDGVYLEYKEKKYMPFDYKVLDEVLWRSYGEGKLKLEDSQVSILKNMDNLLYARTIIPLSRKGSTSSVKEPGSYSAFSVMKRFREESRVVYVWYANTSVKRLGDEGFSPVLLVQKGYSVMASATLPDGSSGCVLRSYTSSVPTFPNKPSESEMEQEAQHREVGLLTEMVFAAYQQCRQSINQTLENLVLDEMMAKNAASTPATSSADTPRSACMRR